MRSPPEAVVWLVRLLLLGLAFSAPGLAFAVWSSATGDAEQAISGLWPGLVGSLLVLGAYALTWRTTALGRLGRFGAAIAGILILWGGFIFLTNFRPL